MTITSKSPTKNIPFETLELNHSARGCVSPSNRIVNYGNLIKKLNSGMPELFSPRKLMSPK